MHRLSYYNTGAMGRDDMFGRAFTAPMARASFPLEGEFEVDEAVAAVFAKTFSAEETVHQTLQEPQTRRGASTQDDVIVRPAKIDRKPSERSTEL